MILAILIISYKKINRIKGFKIAKLKFELGLETEIMKAVVILCGGDPANAPHLFNSVWKVSNTCGRESRVGKGISAQASHRTVREALASYGSYHITKHA